MGAVAKLYTRQGFLILYIRKCSNIQSYMRRPLVIYDFATAPFWISLYRRKIVFSFFIRVYILFHAYPSCKKISKQKISHTNYLFQLISWKKAYPSHICEPATTNYRYNDKLARQNCCKSMAMKIRERPFCPYKITRHNMSFSLLIIRPFPDILSPLILRVRRVRRILRILRILRVAADAAGAPNRR